MNEQAAMLNQQQLMLNINQSNMNSQMLPINRSYGMWGQQQQQFQNPNLSSDAMKPPPSAVNKSLGPRSNWKGKRVNNHIAERRMEQLQQSLVSSGGIGGGGGNLNCRNYNPSTLTLNELEHRNRLKVRKAFQKKKLNENFNMNMAAGNGGRSAPFAPRNTTSFLMRAKRSGGIASEVSPFPVTPSVLATPILSPSTEALGNMAKEEWGVDGYGSMKGLIRLRSLGNEDEGGSSVEEHVEVERRLDHDLSRFEMIYDPNSRNAVGGGVKYHNVLENRVDDQDSHIALLEEENLILNERLFSMEGEFGDLRRRLLSLERRVGQEVDGGGEVVELESESENERVNNGENTRTHTTGENGEEDMCEVEGVSDGRSGGGFEGEAEETREGSCVEGGFQSGDEGMKRANKDDGDDSIEIDNLDCNVGSKVETAENVDDDQSCKQC